MKFYREPRRVQNIEGQWQLYILNKPITDLFSLMSLVLFMKMSRRLINENEGMLNVSLNCKPCEILFKVIKGESALCWGIFKSSFCNCTRNISKEQQE